MQLLQNSSESTLFRRAQCASTYAFPYRSFLLAIGFILIVLFQIAATGVAQDAAPVASDNTATTTEATTNAATDEGIAHADILVDDRAILQVTDVSSTEALARADLVNRRLERLIEREPDVPRFTKDQIVLSAGQPQIRLGGEPILTVTQADAEYNLTAAPDLALLWGGKLSVAVAEARNSRANPLRGVGYLIRHSFRDLIQSIATWLPRLAGAILVWMVFWLLARGSRWIVQTVMSRVPLDPNLRQLGIAMSFYGVWAAGFMAILTTLGIDSTSIATAVGISGFVLGFAFKDILSHFFAGLMLLMGRQLHIGGQIVVGQYEGTVERIELRALHLRTYDNRLVIIPNGDVFTSAVTSNTALAHRRREFFVGITYDADLQEALKVTLDAVRSTDGVLEEPVPEVLVHELGASSVNLRVLFYTSTLRADLLQIHSECIRHVKEALARESITIPLDSQNIYIRNLDEFKTLLQELVSQNQVLEPKTGEDRNQNDDHGDSPQPPTLRKGEAVSIRSAEKQTLGTIPNG